MEAEDFEIIRGEDSSVKVHGILNKESIQKHINAAADTIQREDTFKGFRKGMAPAEVVQQKYGSMVIWTEAARMHLSSALPLFFAKNNITPLDQPKINFVSVVDGGEIKFTIDITTLPNMEISRIESALKGIKALDGDFGVTDKEVEEVIEDIKVGIFRTSHPEGETPNNLPNLTLEDIEKIYPSAKSLDDFKSKIKVGIVEEKKRMHRLSSRNSILDKLLEEFEFVVPKELVDREIENGWMVFQENAKRLGTTVENFLSEKNTTEDKIKEDMRSEAIKRSKIQIMLNVIAGEKGIVPDPRIVEKEVERIKVNKKDLKEEHIRVYIQSALTNEETMKYLEGLVDSED